MAHMYNVITLAIQTSYTMRSNKTVLVYLLFNVGFISSTFAQAGSLDITFNSTGIQTTDFGAQDFGNAVVIQPDGKIVVAGSTSLGGNFAITRYNTNGNLDLTFDTDGKQSTSLGGGTDESNAIALQSDGKIVIAGQSTNAGSFDFGVVRYNSNGSLDNSFSSDGMVVTPIQTDDDFPYAVRIQPDGKIVVAGFGIVGASNDFAVVRYNSDGGLDSTFDMDGKQTTDLGFGGDDRAYACVIQPDGKILVAGYATGPSSKDFAVVRYNSNGSLDASFDTDGKVLTDLGSFHDIPYAMALQTDGKIVIGGGSSDGTYDDFAVVRYNIDGSLDLSFDGDGKVITPLITGTDCISALTIQSDGKIVVVGYTYVSGNTDFGVARYNLDGSLDDCFSDDGMQITPIGSGFDDGQGVAIQTDGKIIAVGDSHDASTGFDFAILRYLGVCDIGINDEPDNETKVNVYPNPSNGEFTLKLSNDFDEPLEVKIVNGFGETMYTKNLSTTTEYMNVAHLSSGTYYIQIIGKNVLLNKAVIIMPD
jgi:uncharacterized delta-60 repeat protein